MFCTNCGRENPDSNKFCLQCGRPLAAGATAAAQSAAQEQPRRSVGRLPLILGGVALLVALAVGAWFLLPRLTGGEGREMLLAAPNRNGEVDLSVLRLGDDPKEAVVIAENVTPSSTTSLGTLDNAGDYRNIFGEYGNFLPGGNRLAAHYTEDGKTRLVEYVPGDEAPIEIYNKEAIYLNVALLPGSGSLFITDYIDSSDSRCYVASPGVEAERVARAGDCSFTADGTHFITRDSNNDGELTVTLADLDGGNEITLLDDVAAQSAQVSADASHIAYLRSTEDGKSFVLLSAAGEELFISDELAQFSSFGFAGKSDTFYYVADTNDGEWELRTSAGGGPPASAPALRVLAAPDGATLAVLTADEEGASEVSVITLATGESVKVASGDNLRMAQLIDPPRLLVNEQVDGDLKLVAAEWSGANAVTLFDDNDYILGDMTGFPGAGWTLLTLMRDNLLSLYVAPLDGAPGHFILEDWSMFRVLNGSDDTLLLTGYEDEGDDDVLYAVSLAPDAKLVELDDSADRYGYAVVTPDGRSTLYNAITGDNPDDVVVRRARLDGEEKPEDLFEETWLAAASWADIIPGPNPSVYWLDAGEIALAVHGEAQRISGDFHAGAITDASTLDLPVLSDQTIYGDLLAFFGRAGQTVRIDIHGSSTIASSLDPAAMLLDGDLNQINWNDDGGSGSDAQINSTLPEDGIYYLLVTSPGGESFGDGNEMAYEAWISWN